MTVANLAQRLRQVDIQVEIVDNIARASSGKFRTVSCNLPKEARESIANIKAK